MRNPVTIRIIGVVLSEIEEALSLSVTAAIVHRRASTHRLARRTRDAFATCMSRASDVPSFLRVGASRIGQHVCDPRGIVAQTARGDKNRLSLTVLDGTDLESLTAAPWRRVA